MKRSVKNIITMIQLITITIIRHSEWKKKFIYVLNVETIIMMTAQQKSLISLS